MLEKIEVKRGGGGKGCGKEIKGDITKEERK